MLHPLLFLSSRPLSFKTHFKSTHIIHPHYSHTLSLTTPRQLTSLITQFLTHSLHTHTHITLTHIFLTHSQVHRGLRGFLLGIRVAGAALGTHQEV